MRETGALDPFMPGTGGLPPYLAGRETEQAYLRKVLGRLQQGAPASTEVILYGPRGNGKTALLRWFKRQVEADDTVEACALTPSDIPTPEMLAQCLPIESWFERLAPESVSVAGFGVSLRQPTGQRVLAEALRAQARKRALLILLDEAHTLEPGVGRLLLNAAQSAGREAPLVLILAGTPDLKARLSKMEASFWSRARAIPVGRLSEGAAADAIRRPLSQEGVEIEPEALERIVGESHGYPFFLQVWGSAVWDNLPEDPAVPRRVSSAVVEAAAPEFEDWKGHYYLERYEELRDRSLLPAARAIAGLFRDEGALTDRALDAALRDATLPEGPDPAAAERSLRHLGFIWRVGPKPVWEPGIPSLMDFILENTEPAPASG